MKLLLILLPAVLFSQPVITQGPFVGTGTISRSSASIAWATNVPATQEIYWSSTSSGSVTPASCTSPACNKSAPLNGYNSLQKWHNWYTYGTPGGSTIWFQVCSETAVGNTPNCSSTSSYISKTQAVVPASPTLPTPVDTPTTPIGTPLTVGANCDDPTTGLVAQWTAADVAGGGIVEIDPSITPYCSQKYVFPGRTTHGYILTRVKNASQTFPGGRRANPGDLPTAAGFAAGTNKMARFIHSAPTIEQPGVGTLAGGKCFAGNMAWRAGQSNSWQMFYCNNTNPQSITSATTTGNLQFTIPSHGIPNGQGVYVTGATGTGAAVLNQTFQSFVIDSNTVEMHRVTDLYSEAEAITSGGAVDLTNAKIYTNQFVLIPNGTGVNQVTQGSANPPTGSCTFGSWYHLNAGTGANDEYHRTWYCDGPNEWIQVRIDVNFNLVTTSPVIDIATNKLDHLMFQGLSFEPMHLAADPQRLQFQWEPTSLNDGYSYFAFIGQTIYNDHIYWDNILAGAPDPSLAGEMEQMISFCDPCDGTQVHFGGSYFYGNQVFQSLQGAYDNGNDAGEASVMEITQGGPFELVNNYMACAGICVYAIADLDTVTDFHDMTMRANTIETPDRYWQPTSPLVLAGFIWERRHNSERKRVNRELDDGNITLGGWVYDNQGASYCLCSRTEQGVVMLTLTDDGAHTAIVGYEPGIVSHGWMFNDLHIGDLMTIIADPSGCTGASGKIVAVTGITDYTHFQVATTGCTGTGGQITRLSPATGGISDYTISNNMWVNNPTDIAFLGHDSYPTSEGPVLQRLMLSNNLSVGLDGTRLGLFYVVNNGGSHIIPGDGGEDLQSIHETVVGRTEECFMAGDFSTDGAAQGSGLLIRDSIMEYLNLAPPYPTNFNGGGQLFESANNSYFGTAALNHEWADLGGTSPSWKVNSVAMSSSGSVASNPSGILWFTGLYGAFPFWNPVSNYRIQTQTACIGAASCESGGHLSTDGLQEGANINAIEAANGTVSNVRAYGITSAAASIGWYQGGAACSGVDWAVGVLSVGPSNRVAYSGPAGAQHVDLTGLPATSSINYRVNCGTAVFGTFSTP